MAAAYSTGNAAAVNDSGSTTYDSGSITVPSGAVVYALVGNSEGAGPADPTGVSLDPGGTPQAFTKLNSSGTLATYGNATLWRLTNATGVTAVVRATWAANKSERGIVVWVGTGIDTSTPNGTVGTADNNTTSPSATATTTTGQLVLSMCYFLDTAPSTTDYTSPSGTQRHKAITSPDEYLGLVSQDQTAAGSSTSPSWTISEALDRWYMVAIPLNAAAGGSGWRAAFARQANQSIG